MRLIDIDALDRHWRVPEGRDEDSYDDGALLILNRIEEAPIINASTIKINDLDACPFCKGEAKLILSNHGNNFSAAWVTCTQCKCETKRIPISLEYSAAEKAKELWNAREE